MLPSSFSPSTSTANLISFLLLQLLQIINLETCVTCCELYTNLLIPELIACEVPAAVHPRQRSKVSS